MSKNVSMLILIPSGFVFKKYILSPADQLVMVAIMIVLAISR